MFDTALLKKTGLTVGIVYAAAYAAARANFDMRHFTAGEFGLWLPLLNPKLLDKLDQFRDYLNAPVIISPAIGAIGRLTPLRPGQGKTEHRPAPLVDAIDVMLPETTLAEGVTAARTIGFTGFGVYPAWKPYHGMHLDVRSDRDREHPATWAGIPNSDGKQIYVALEQGLKYA